MYSTYVTNSLFETYIKGKMYFRKKISSSQRKFARMYEIIDFICACLSLYQTLGVMLSEIHIILNSL